MDDSRPLTILGSTVRHPVEHVEVWRFYEDIEEPRDEDAAVALAERLGL